MRQLPILATISFLGCLFFSTEGQARNGAFYFQVAPGYGTYETTEVVIDKSGNFPETNFTPSLQMGLNLFGYGGFYGEFTAFGWDLTSSNIGGGGFAGGGVRILPLELLQYLWPHVWPDMPLIPTASNPEGVSWHDRPFELGLSWGMGYHMLGEEYAYEAEYTKFGIDLQYFVTDTFAVGLDFPFYTPIFEPVRVTDWEDNMAACVDGGDFVVTKEDPSRYRIYNKDQITDDTCTGVAPRGSFSAAYLTITMLADFGI